MQASPLLALLRRLEAQNIWRMSYSVMPRQAAAAEADQQLVEQGEGGTFSTSSPSLHRPPSATPALPSPSTASASSWRAREEEAGGGGGERARLPPPPPLSSAHMHSRPLFG